MVRLTVDVPVLVGRDVDPVVLAATAVFGEDGLWLAPEVEWVDLPATVADLREHHPRLMEIFPWGGSGDRTCAEIMLAQETGRGR